MCADVEALPSSVLCLAFPPRGVAEGREVREMRSTTAAAAAGCFFFRFVYICACVKFWVLMGSFPGKVVRFPLRH